MTSSYNCGESNGGMAREATGAAPLIMSSSGGDARRWRPPLVLILRAFMGLTAQTGLALSPKRCKQWQKSGEIRGKVDVGPPVKGFLIRPVSSTKKSNLSRQETYSKPWLSSEVIENLFFNKDPYKEESLLDSGFLPCKQCLSSNGHEGATNRIQREIVLLRSVLLSLLYLPAFLFDVPWTSILRAAIEKKRHLSVLPHRKIADTYPGSKGWLKASKMRPWACSSYLNGHADIVFHIVGETSSLIPKVPINLQRHQVSVTVKGSGFFSSSQKTSSPFPSPHRVRSKANTVLFSNSNHAASKLSAVVAMRLSNHGGHQAAEFYKGGGVALLCSLNERSSGNLHYSSEGWRCAAESHIAALASVSSSRVGKLART